MKKKIFFIILLLCAVIIMPKSIHADAELIINCPESGKRGNTITCDVLYDSAYTTNISGSLNTQLEDASLSGHTLSFKIPTSASNTTYSVIIENITVNGDIAVPDKTVSIRVK